jgi:phospholipase C
MTQLLFDHIIVLMLENRSFDHLFGHLGKGDGLTADAVNYLKPGDASSQPFKTGHGGDFTAVGEGPSHSLKQTNEQLFGVTKPTAAQSAGTPPLDGFVASFKTSLTNDLKRKPTATELQQVMNVFDPEQLPVLSTLAREFVLCDRWFADVPGPTMPNRAFVHAATSQGYTYNANWKPEFTCKTLYDRINASGGARSWRIYSHDNDDVLELYSDLDKDVTNHVHFESSFVQDVAGDKLASYSFIVPAFFHSAQHPINSMHAPADVRPAEKLVADIYGALQANESVWKKTLLIVLFDEHGGYYDHVPPPATVSPDGIDGRLDKPFLVPFDFKRLGLRVPAILVSPWFKAGVDSTVYSHSTIPGSVIEAFGLPGGFLTKRDEKANKLTAKYLTKQPGHKWRTNVPVLVPPPQPRILSGLQQELLAGSVNLDPYPKNRNMLRTHDIIEQSHAKTFVRTQNTKRLEHYFASKRLPKGTKKEPWTENQTATASFSPARIAELRESV